MAYRKRKSIRTAILALATAALLVPAAQAHTDFGSNGSGGVSASSTVPYAHLPQEDRQAIAVGQGSTTTASTSSAVQSSGYSPQALKAIGERYTKMAEAYQATRPDDRAGVRGPGPVETPPVVTTHDGFDWTDAGIGASAMLFVAALIAAALLARRRPSIAV
jgi:hypothetical protein